MKPTACASSGSGAFHPCPGGAGVYSGRRLATISLADFLAAATVVLEENRTGAFNLFYEPMPTYREFVRGLRAGRRTLFLPIPVSFAMGLAHAAAWLRAPIPFRPGQIRTLLANQTSPWRSDLPSLIAPPR